jgi:hypothetical protein
MRLWQLQLVSALLVIAAAIVGYAMPVDETDVHTESSQPTQGGQS